MEREKWWQNRGTGNIFVIAYFASEQNDVGNMINCLLNMISSLGKKIIIKFHFRVLYAWIEVDWLTNMIKNLATGNIMNKKIVVKRHISMSCQRNFRICASFFLVRGVKRTTYLLLWSDFSILPLFVFNHSGFVYAAKHIHVSCL